MNMLPGLLTENGSTMVPYVSGVKERLYCDSPAENALLTKIS